MSASSCSIAFIKKVVQSEPRGPVNGQCHFHTLLMEKEGGGKKGQRDVCIPKCQPRH